MTELLENTLCLLDSDAILVSNYRAQEKIPDCVGALSKTMTKATALQSNKIIFELAIQNKLSVALQMHCDVANVKSGTVWAAALKEVLGVNFTTEAEAKSRYSKHWDETVDPKMLQHGRVKAQYEALILEADEEDDRTVEVQAVIDKKNAELKLARKGEQLYYFYTFYVHTEHEYIEYDINLSMHAFPPTFHTKHEQYELYAA